MKNTFGKNIIPDNDKKRLEALYSYDILDTENESNFDRLTELAAKVLNMPIALISFVDKERVFFKSNHGMGDTQNVERGISFCSLAVLDKNVTVIDNPEQDPCTMANPLVTGEFGLRFYAGAPITTPDGYNIGTVCVVDKKPRYITRDQKTILADIATITMDYLLMRQKIVPQRL